MTRRERSDHAQLLYELACALPSKRDLDDLVPSVISRCRELLRAEGAALLLVDPETDELYFPYVSERDESVAAKLGSVRFPATEGIAGAALVAGHGLHVPDVNADARFYDSVDADTGLTTREILAAPLTSRRGAIGVLQAINHLGDEGFSADDLSLLEAIAGVVAVALENAQMWGELRAKERDLRDEVTTLRLDQARRKGFSGIVGSSEALTELFALMESAAACPLSVLIEGETGTGKELVARGIHDAGERADGPFVAVNCAALPSDLIESELFGHAKGAFTGAVRDHRGFFEAANGGSMFLDEVGELPIHLQAKLLRTLQEGEITPLGTADVRSIDVRIIAATNNLLEEAVSAGAFREDLYYRLAQFPISVPPLRERRGDVALLADHFLVNAIERHKKRISGFDPRILELYAQYAWPGNVRELENEVERAIALTADGETIGMTAVSKRIRAGLSADTIDRIVNAVDVEIAGTAEASEAESAEEFHLPLREARSRFDAQYIRGALKQHGGNVSHTAKALGMSRVMLQKKMKEHGLRDG